MELDGDLKHEVMLRIRKRVEDERVRKFLKREYLNC